MIPFEKLLQENSKAPRPFPGEYPTRVSLVAEGKVPFKYVGKPVPGLLKYFQRNYIVKKGSSREVSFREVDQNGLVRYQAYGELPFQVSFADLYYPLFPRWYDATHWATLLALLGREPITVDGKQGYRCSFMDDCLARESLDRMTQQFIKGRLHGDWFAGGANRELIEFLNKKTQNFLDSVFGVEVKKSSKGLNARARRAAERNVRFGRIVTPTTGRMRFAAHGGANPPVVGPPPEQPFRGNPRNPNRIADTAPHPLTLRDVQTIDRLLGENPAPLEPLTTTQAAPPWNPLALDMETIERRTLAELQLRAAQEAQLQLGRQAEEGAGMRFNNQWDTTDWNTQGNW